MSKAPKGRKALKGQRTALKVPKDFKVEPVGSAPKVLKVCREHRVRTGRVAPPGQRVPKVLKVRRGQVLPVLRDRPVPLGVAVFKALKVPREVGHTSSPSC